MKKEIYSIRMTAEMGRSVFAERYIKKGETIENCELLILSTEDTNKINETKLKWYSFTYNKETKQDCLVLGIGEIFNHSDIPNVVYKLIDYDFRKIMRFQACRDIEKGEQLFIDYTADVDEIDIKGYNVNLF